MEGFHWRLYVCLFIRTISQKPDAARIIKLKCSMMSPVKLLIAGQKVKGQGHESKNTTGVSFCTLVSAGF